MIKDPEIINVKNIENIDEKDVSLCLHKFFKPSDIKKDSLSIMIF